MYVMVGLDGKHRGDIKISACIVTNCIIAV